MDDWRGKMQKAVRHLADQLAGIRTGTLSVGFIETFRVSLRGSTVPMARLAMVAGRKDRIVVTPFDPADVPAVVKALTDARLNAYAADRATVCVGIPPISGDQRADIERHVKTLGEEAKVAVRAIRQATRQKLAASGRRSDRAVQEATDAAIVEVERLVKAKVAELGR